MFKSICYDILGCWGTAEPAQFLAASPSVNVANQLNCVVGNPGNDGKWATIGCSVSPAVPAVVASQGPPVIAQAAAITSVPSKMGSICERDDEQASTTPSAPATPPPASGSTSFKSGTAFVLGTLFLLF